MRLSELFSRAGLEYPVEKSDVDILSIVTDSRKVTKGSLFICIKGLHSDGHDYISEAIKSGAIVIVAERVRDVEVVGAATTVLVDDTRHVTALLYNSWYKNPTENMCTVAVTGTNGKTSVCFILKKIFEDAGFRCGLIGTVRCMSGNRVLRKDDSNPLANMTTPDPDELYRLLSVMEKDKVQYVFMEASSHALALSKLDAIRFDTAVLTNFTKDHLDFHRTTEEYFKAKSKLFSMCEKAVINLDSPFSKEFISYSNCKNIFTVSTKSDADFTARDIEYKNDSTSKYSFIYENGNTEINVPLAGRFFIENSLLAASCAMIHKIDGKQIAKSVNGLECIDGRMEKVDLGEKSDITVIIDYAHTPDAMENLLKSVAQIKKDTQRTVLLFGCGGDRDRSKRAEMAHIASRLSDFVIVTSDNSRNEDPKRIFDDILKGIDKEKEYVLIEKREDAINYAVKNSRKGDFIVLAGKGHEKYEIDKRGKHPFDERKTVKEAYKKYRLDIDLEGY